MRKFSFWEQAQMSLARVVLWSLEGGWYRTSLCAVLAFEVFYLVPTSFLPGWADMVFFCLFLFLLWKHDSKKLALWLAHQSENLWAVRHRELMDQLVLGGLDTEEAFMLLRMHRHAELRKGVLNEEEWHKEEKILAERLFGPGEFEDEDEDEVFDGS